MPKLFHPLLSLIASATGRELARYVQYLKEENKVLHNRLGDQVHTKPEERLVHFGKGLGRAIEELITIVAPSTFYRWVRDEQAGKKTLNPKGAQRLLTGFELFQVHDFQSLKLLRCRTDARTILPFSAPLTVDGCESGPTLQFLPAEIV